MHTTRSAHGLLHKPWQKATLLLCLAALVYAAPYMVPVRPAVSVSYVVNYSNRAAVVLFLGGALVFSFLTAGQIARWESRDSKLSLRSLLLAEAIVSILLAVHLWATDLGWEAAYVLHRQQMLVAGRHLYTQTDYLYGPALVLPGIWLTHLLHISPVAGYMTSYICLEIAGVWMIWFVIGRILFPFRFRWALFAAIVAIESTSLIAAGTHYTPIRVFISAFAACLLFAVFTRTRNAWITAGTGIGGFVICLMVSPEQAIGFTAGALGWFILCRARRMTGFSVPAIAFFSVVALLVFTSAARYGMFREMRCFAAGAYAFPLVPSFETCIILFVYVAGIAALWRAVVARQEDGNNTALLCLVGIAMLPAAMGRCDLGHLCSAMPLTLIGAASLLTMPRLRPWFAAVSLGFFVVPLFYFDLIWMVGHEAKVRLHQPLQARSSISFDQLPCDRSYYAPELILQPDKPYHLDCVDLGYKRGILDVYTAGQIADEVTEIVRRPGKSLLLRNRPFEELFRPHEPTGLLLRRTTLEGRWPFYVPTDKNAPLSLEPIGDYILAHYTPGPTIIDDQVRIWYPKLSTDK